MVQSLAQRWHLLFMSGVSGRSREQPFEPAFGQLFGLAKVLATCHIRTDESQLYARELVRDLLMVSTID